MHIKTEMDWRSAKVWKAEFEPKLSCSLVLLLVQHRNRSWRLNILHSFKIPSLKMSGTGVQIHLVSIFLKDFKFFKYKEQRMIQRADIHRNFEH